MKQLGRELSSILPRKLVYFDVGARWGLAEPWKPWRSLLSVVSFEPDAEEYRRLLKETPEGDRVLPHALYRESAKINLHLTRARGCSSIYPPNVQFLNRFPDPERFEVERIETISAASLDDLKAKGELGDIDFLKVDVQGAELDVLMGGKQLLAEKCLGLEVEVGIQPLYCDQPLFGDVDSFVRKNLGLELFDLRKAYWKRAGGTGLSTWKGQVAFGDALYLRSPESLPKWCEQFSRGEAAAKITMACAIAFAYGYLDYVACLLEQPKISSLLEPAVLSRLRKLVHSHGKGWRIDVRGSGPIQRFFESLSKVFHRTHGGWATGGHPLGSRKRFGIFS